jgi:uncharacterized ion transporter superfamily protein YfcC
MFGAAMSRLRFPHPLALLSGCVLVAAILSHVLPAGQYDRRDDAATGRRVVVAGTFHAVEARPVGFFQMLVAVPKGMVDAGSVIFLVFLVGGAFTVVDRTGALKQGVGWLVSKLEGREAMVIPVISVLFCVGGALENMQEEIIALVPVLLLLTRRLGFTPLTAVAISFGPAAVGAAFSPINPFQVGIAQKLAQLPPLSGGAFRAATLVIALAVWIWGTMRHAARTRVPPAVDLRAEQEPFDARRMLVLATVLAAFGLFIIGVMRLGWDFDEMSALFLLMGILAGVIGGLGIGGTADAFAEGFRSMAYAAMLIGFARAVYIVLDQGQVIDTVVHGLVAPLTSLPVTVAALGMIVVDAIIHVPVPSVSGQAVLTMPVLIPLSDILGMSRQVTVLGYQVGAGLCEILTPTNGALMAIIAAAGVRYEEWLRFAVRLYLLLMAFGMASVIAGIAVGLH